MKCGVYCIRNSINNKRYVGSSNKIEYRFTAHRSLLRRGVHDNPRLQNAWNKYGEGNFAFEVVEECAPESRYEREQFFMDHFDTVNGGYNIAPIANLPPMTEDTKAKISLAMKGRKPWITGKHHKEETRCKISAANKLNNKMRDKNGPLHHFYGCHHSDVTKEKMRQAKLGKNNRRDCSRAVEQLLDGKVVEVFPSSREAERQTGVFSKNISKCLTGKRQTAGGYAWRYAS